MRKVQSLAPEGAAAAATATLTFDERRKSRQRLRLDDGGEVALLLPRGTVLRAGDRLQADDGLVVAIAAAPETLSSVSTDHPLLLARAAYHLGNRHVPLEVASGRLRYQHDHVLDGMVRALGLAVDVVEAPFQPEAGAYGGQRHDHDHDHGHDHDHDHDHHHDHGHGHGHE
jgi:urease accessory protein